MATVVERGEPAFDTLLQIYAVRSHTALALLDHPFPYAPAIQAFEE